MNKEIVLIKDLGMLYPTSKSMNKSRYGLYKCYCGNEFKARTQDIKRNKTMSCGCSKVTHSLANHRLYKTWYDMIDRCINPKCKAYKDYGNRGIIVCNEWLDINNFIKDMNQTYEVGLTIDRIDNNKGYSKDNCRWTTRAIQARNTRKIRTTNKSGFRGVSWFRTANKWIVHISINSKKIHLGLFEDKIDAAKAYDKYIIDNNLEHTLNFNKGVNNE